MIATALYFVTMVLVLFFDLIYFTPGSKNPGDENRKAKIKMSDG